MNAVRRYSALAILASAFAVIGGAASAQITINHAPDDLVGSLVMAVVNFPPRQIGPFLSEVLTLGVPDANGDVMLIRPDRDVPLGGRLY